MAWAWAFGVALAVALAAWRGPLWRPRALPGVDRARPWALGHRGVRGSLPENTMAAYTAALEAGLDGLEVDVQRTRDGHLVMVHDDDAGGLRVVDADLAALRARVPDLATFDELLELVGRHPGALLNVELKTRGWNDRGLAGAVAARMRTSGVRDRTLVSSFSPLALARLRLRAPELRVGYLWSAHAAVPRWLRTPWPAGWLHVDALHPEHPLVSRAAVAAWHRRGALVQTWTVNAAADVARVRAAGVDGIIGDDPHALRRALAASPAGEPPEEAA